MKRSKMMRSVGVGMGMLTALSCASTSQNKRTFLYSVGGAAGGAITGAALSPNPESRVLNGVVFGLSGALLAGAAALIWGQDRVNESDKKGSLREREFSQEGELTGRSYQLAPQENLPEFVKQRFRPVIIEEFVERDRVSEEGALHEPHKVYRIKRPAELITGSSDALSASEGSER